MKRFWLVGLVLLVCAALAASARAGSTTNPLLLGVDNTSTQPTGLNGEMGITSLSTIKLSAQEEFSPPALLVIILPGHSVKSIHLGLIGNSAICTMQTMGSARLAYAHYSSIGTLSVALEQPVATKTAVSCMVIAA